MSCTTEERVASAASDADRAQAGASGARSLLVTVMTRSAGVPFVELSRQHASIADELRAAFERTLAGSAFILGHEVEAFEAQFAEHCGAEHCVGVASGTAALAIGLRAAGVGRGDEVVVPAHTYIATALAVLHTGARPVFCDVEDDTGLMDPDSAAAAVSGRTAAIVPVHLYGQACDMDQIGALARRHGLLLLEDAAQAHGATWRGRTVGSIGTAAAFSFYPSKNLGALGDGGAICTSDGAIAERARRLRNLGQRRKGRHSELGFNERLDGLQAALLRVKLPHLDVWNAARARHAERYRTLLPTEIRMVAEDPRSPSVHHLLAVRTPERDALAAALAEAGIQTGLHYTPAVHHQPPCARAVRSRTDLRCAEAWAREELSLPMFAEMTADEVDRVAEACVAWSAGYST
jgi:dTDP-4-amino-4,6-dideoxygalactose transaminase